MQSQSCQKHSKYIVYVDESGDHGWANHQYPMFVLAFCIFEKEEYTTKIIKGMHDLKFKYFGHDCEIFHEREIRKASQSFSFLQNPTLRHNFMCDLNSLISNSKFTIVAAAINKESLARRYSKPFHPYHLALEFGLERIRMFLDDNGESEETFVVFEGRGRKEDKDLELEFRRICDSDSFKSSESRLTPMFASKKANHCGLQFADLFARPIGLKVYRNNQPNRAYDIIEPKFRRSPKGTINGYGLKSFP